MAKPNLEGVDQRLLTTYYTTRDAFRTAHPGWDVVLTSGNNPRPNNPNSQHPRGNALDVQIIDADGNKLGNYQDPKTYRIYEQFARGMRAVQQEQYPELDQKLAWGGYFGDKKHGMSGYGALDQMHFDLGGSRGWFGSWERGLNQAAAKQFGTSQNQLDDISIAGAQPVGVFQHLRPHDEPPDDSPRTASEWGQTYVSGRASGTKPTAEPDRRTASEWGARAFPSTDNSAAARSARSAAQTSQTRAAAGTPPTGAGSRATREAAPSIAAAAPKDQPAKSATPPPAAATPPAPVEQKATPPAPTPAAAASRSAGGRGGEATPPQATQAAPQGPAPAQNAPITREATFVQPTPAETAPTARTSQAQLAAEMLNPQGVPGAGPTYRENPFQWSEVTPPAVPRNEQERAQLERNQQAYEFIRDNKVTPQQLMQAAGMQAQDWAAQHQPTGRQQAAFFFENPKIATSLMNNAPGITANAAAQGRAISSAVGKAGEALSPIGQLLSTVASLTPTSPRETIPFGAQGVPQGYNAPFSFGQLQGEAVPVATPAAKSRGGDFGTTAEQVDRAQPGKSVPTTIDQLAEALGLKPTDQPLVAGQTIGATPATQQAGPNTTTQAGPNVGALAGPNTTTPAGATALDTVAAVPDVTEMRSPQETLQAFRDEQAKERMDREAAEAAAAAPRPGEVQGPATRSPDDELLAALASAVQAQPGEVQGSATQMPNAASILASLGPSAEGNIPAAINEQQAMLEAGSRMSPAEVAAAAAEGFNGMRGSPELAANKLDTNQIPGGAGNYAPRSIGELAAGMEPDYSRIGAPQAGTPQGAAAGWNTAISMAAPSDFNRQAGPITPQQLATIIPSITGQNLQGPTPQGNPAGKTLADQYREEQAARAAKSDALAIPRPGDQLPSITGQLPTNTGRLATGGNPMAAQGGPNQGYQGGFTTIARGSPQGPTPATGSPQQAPQATDQRSASGGAGATTRGGVQVSGGLPAGFEPNFQTFANPLTAAGRGGGAANLITEMLTPFGGAQSLDAVAQQLGQPANLASAVPGFNYGGGAQSPAAHSVLSSFSDVLGAFGSGGGSNITSPVNQIDFGQLTDYDMQGGGGGHSSPIGNQTFYDEGGGEGSDTLFGGEGTQSVQDYAGGEGGTGGTTDTLDYAGGDQQDESRPSSGERSDDLQDRGGGGGGGADFSSATTVPTESDYFSGSTASDNVASAASGDNTPSISSTFDESFGTSGGGGESNVGYSPTTVQDLIDALGL